MMKHVTNASVFGHFLRTPRAVLFASAMSAGLCVGLSAASAEIVTVWSGYPELAPFYEHVAKGFKETHPDVDIDIQAIPLREHERRIALRLSSGASDTTIIEIAGSNAARYLENDLFPKAPQRVVDFVSDPQHFGPFFVESVSYGDAVYGMPLFRGQSALFYNTDKFEAAGLTEPPQTMTEYNDYAEKLTERDDSGKPVVSGWSLRLSGGGQGIAQKFAINMFQFDGALWLEEVTPGKYRINLNNEGGRAAFKQYLDNVHTLNTVSVEMPADAEAFEREQTAMFIRESWVIGDIAAKAPDLNYATAPLPHGAIALPTNLYVSGEGDGAEAAWDFALATNDPENLVWMLENVGWLPNRNDVDYTPITDKEEAFAAFVAYPDDYKFFTEPAIGPLEELQTRLAARLTNGFADSELASDEEAMQKFLQDAEDEANKILQREGLLAE